MNRRNVVVLRELVVELNAIIAAYEVDDTDSNTVKRACDRAFDALNQLDFTED